MTVLLVGLILSLGLAAGVILQIPGLIFVAMVGCLLVNLAWVYLDWGTEIVALEIASLFFILLHDEWQRWQML